MSLPHHSDIVDCKMLALSLLGRCRKPLMNCTLNPSSKCATVVSSQLRCFSQLFARRVATAAPFATPRIGRAARSPLRSFSSQSKPLYTSNNQAATPPSSSSPPPSSNSSFLGSFWQKLALLSAIGVSGTVLSAYMLGLSLADVRELINEVFSSSPNKAKNPDDAFQAPVPLDLPEAFVHPYDLLPWYTRYWFMFKRSIFLSYIAFPVILSGLYTFFFCSDDSERVKRWFEWLALQMTRAGATFQKFGQWISMRPDVFVPELIEAVSHLREHAPAHSYEETRQSFRESIGKELEEVFEFFDPKPVASGTIAQVHRGILRPEYAFDNGTREVAVKIRHPNVLAETWFDGWLVMHIMPILAKLGPELAMPFKMDTFHSILHKQVDFKWEAYHLSVFAANFAREIAEAKKMQAERLERLAQQASAKVSSTVETVTNKIEQLSTATGVPNHSLLFPAVCAKLVSDRVLVETWARGVTVAELFPKLAKVADSERNAAFSAAANPDINAPVDPIQQQTWLQKVAKEEEAAALSNRPNTSQWRRSDADASLLLEQANLANKIADMSFKMFLRDNYVHCDLHAGNLLYDRETDTLTVIDVGLVTKIEKDVAPAFGDFLRALVVLDSKTLAQKLMQFHNPAAVAPNKAGPVLKEIEEDMRTHLMPFQGKKFDVGDVVALVLHRIPHLRLMIRDDVAGNLCAMAFCEGLIMSLNPECDLVKASLPYFIRFKGWSSAKQLLEWGYLENDAQSTTATPASPKL